MIKTKNIKKILHLWVTTKRMIPTGNSDDIIV